MELSPLSVVLALGARIGYRVAIERQVIPEQVARSGETARDRCDEFEVGPLSFGALGLDGDRLTYHRIILFIDRFGFITCIDIENIQTPLSSINELV